MTLKLKFYYGNVDDFNKGPKNFIMGVRNENTAYSFRIRPTGIEINRSHRYQPFYEVLWSLSWKRKKKR